MGMTPGGDLWNIPRTSARKLLKFPENERHKIVVTAMRFFVFGKPGDTPPTLYGEKENAMLQEIITGKPQMETEVANGL